MLIPFKELFRRHGIKPTGILHLGANTGQEAEDYKAAGVQNVIWVEANPSLFPKLVSHVRPYGHRALKGCISDKDGERRPFHIANNGGQSSSLLELGTHKEAHPEVKYVADIEITTIRVDSLLKKNGLVISSPGWFLNVDLQGAELLALKGMEGLLKHFSYLYLEVNERFLYVGCPLIGELDCFLDPHGFRRVETKMSGGHGWGDALWIRK